MYDSMMKDLAIEESNNTQANLMYVSINDEWGALNGLVCKY